MGSRLKVVELLSREELDQLEAYARERSRTVDELHAWVQAHGYTVNRSAVYSWRVKFDAELMAERMGRSGELARAVKEAVSGGDFDDVADAAAMQLTQVVFEQSAKLEADGDLDPLDLMRMTRSLANLAGAKSTLVKLLAAKFERAMNAEVAKAPDGKVTADAIAAAGKAIFGV